MNNTYTSCARGEVVVTKNDEGHIVAVTRKDEEGRILWVLDMRTSIYSDPPVGGNPGS